MPHGTATRRSSEPCRDARRRPSGAGVSSLVFLIPIALLLGAAALGTFLWSLKSGQYEDLDGAAERILIDDDEAEGRPVDRP